MFSFTLPEVDDNLLRFVDIGGEIIVAAPVHQILYLIPVLCLVIVSDPTNYGGVISKLENQVGRKLASHRCIRSIVGAENTALWGTGVEDDCKGDVAVYPY